MVANRGLTIKYNKKTICLEVIIFFVILLDFHCMYLFRYPQIMALFLSGNYLNMLVSVIGVSSSLYLLKYKKSAFSKRTYSFFCKYILGLIVSWIFLNGYSVIEYTNQSIAETIADSAYYLYPSLAVSMYYVIKVREDGFRHFINILNIFSAIWYILIIWVTISMKHGKVPIDFETYLKTISNLYQGGYGIRIGLRAIPNFMILHNFYRILSIKKVKDKIINIFLFLIGCYCVIFIQQTRGYLLYLFIGMFGIYIANLKLMNRKISLKKILLFIILIAGVTYMVESNIVTEFISSFSMDSSNAKAASTSIRLSAIEYYIKCFMKNPLFGNGFARAEHYYYVEHGTIAGAYYYYSDVGIIGLLGNIGICAVFMYIYPMLLLLNNTIKNKSKVNVFLIGTLLWLALTSVSLIVVDKGRMILFPIILSICFYIFDQSNDKYVV